MRFPVETRARSMSPILIVCRRGSTRSPGMQGASQWRSSGTYTGSAVDGTGSHTAREAHQMTSSGKRLKWTLSCAKRTRCASRSHLRSSYSDDDDVATCDEDPPEALLPDVKAAISGCPRQAISMVAKS